MVAVVAMVVVFVVLKLVVWERMRLRSNSSRRR